MTVEELEIKVKAALFEKRSFKDLHAAFTLFEKEGGAQSTAYDLCLELHRELRDKDEELSDLIADVADFVSGYCLAERAIWKKDVKS
jgi:hypothetical protein